MINFLKITSILFITALFAFFLQTQTLAQEVKHAVIVNPIRGNDFWEYNHKILDTPKEQYEVISKNNLPATWLVRPDALRDAEVALFLKSLNNQQEVGLFLEVTPTFAKDAGVIYNTSPNWHYAKSAFLIGYSQEDRKKLIDQAVKEYKEKLGKDPKSVGAWWIDAYSLNYLREKYKIEANLDVADQFSTDQYQVWGQYFSTPFYPAKLNALLPAQSPENKIGVVTIQWATRDPFNSYGSGVDESTYSVQANDYMLHKLDSRYFEKLIDIYPQTTVGIENDFNWDKYGNEYQKQIEVLSSKQRSGQLGVATMQNFAQIYKSANPNISPQVLIQAGDPLNTDGKVVWYQTPKYRVGWFYGPYGSAIRDLRIYNDSSREQCYLAACESLDLASTFINSIDDVNLNNQLIVDEGKISNIRVDQKPNEVVVNYVNQAGVTRTIRFLPNDIEINGKVQTLDAAILEATQRSQQVRSEQINTQFDGSLMVDEALSKILINALKFLALTLFFFFLPGYLITRNLFLAIPVGWATFTLVAFVSGLIRFDLLLWGIPILSFLSMIKYGIPKIKLSLDQGDLLVLPLILLGSFTWLLTTVKSGLLYNYGLGFWGPNGHDAIWHLSLIYQLQKGLPPQNPVFSGEVLNNYHYFFDLLVAKSSILFGIDVLELLFRLFPFFIALLIGVLVYKVTSQIFNDKRVGFFATFFAYFGGSFGWVVSYFKSQNFGGESLFWSQQSISTLLNPPYAISLVLLLAGLYIFIDLMKGLRSKAQIIALIVLWGTLVEFKVYAGVLVFAGFAVVVLLRLIQRKDLTTLFIFIASAILSAIVFLPNNLNAPSLLLFSPFWLVHSMVDFPDRLGWERLSLARQAYTATGNYWKFIAAEVLGLVIFILGNFGSRIIIIFGQVKSLTLKTNREVIILLTVMFLVGIIIPLTFTQKGNNWNIVQFFYYSLFIANIFAAVTLVSVWNRFGKVVGLIFASIIILITIPTTLDTLSQYTPSRPPSKLSTQELEALNFLSNQDEGVVFSLAFDPKLKEKYGVPEPLLAYTSTSYVSAFSKKPSFLEDTINLEILDIDYKGRVNEQKDLIRFREQANEILKRNNIKYLYIVKSYGFEENESQMGIQKVFENDEVEVFKVL